MNPQESELRPTGEAHNLIAQTPFDGLRRESGIHPVLRWAEAIVSGFETVPQLRDRVLAMFQDMPDVVMNSTGYWGIGNYALSHEWLTIEPSLTEFAKKTLLLPDSISNRELIGFAKLVHNNTRAAVQKPDDLSPLGILVHPPEYSARLVLAEDFKDSEDWLTALANVVWINGKQIEAENKKQVRADAVSYLSELQEVGIEDLEKIYEGVLTKIRPQAGKVVVFREGESSFDQYVPYISDGRIYRLADNNGKGAKRAIKRYLEIYNSWLNSADRICAEDIAWLSVAYVCIHPHLDFNGTMTRILVDNYVKKRNLKPIDWLRVKTDAQVHKEFNDASEAYTFTGKTQALVEWFGKEIGEIGV